MLEGNSLTSDSEYQTKYLVDDYTVCAIISILDRFKTFSCHFHPTTNAQYGTRDDEDEHLFNFLWWYPKRDQVIAPRHFPYFHSHAFSRTDFRTNLQCRPPPPNGGKNDDVIHVFRWSLLAIFEQRAYLMVIGGSLEAIFFQFSIILGRVSRKIGKHHGCRQRLSTWNI